MSFNDRFTTATNKSGGIMEEIEIWRSAQQIMSLHGDDAAFVASDLAGARMADGNRDGARIWRLVRNAIQELSRTKPNACELLH
jgi:hypothetical protein